MSHFLLTLRTTIEQLAPLRPSSSSFIFEGSSSSSSFRASTLAWPRCAIHSRVKRILSWTPMTLAHAHAVTANLIPRPILGRAGSTNGKNTSAVIFCFLSRGGGGETREKTRRGHGEGGGFCRRCINSADFACTVSWTPGIWGKKGRTGLPRFFFVHRLVIVHRLLIHRLSSAFDSFVEIDLSITF